MEKTCAMKIAIDLLCSKHEFAKQRDAGGSTARIKALNNERLYNNFTICFKYAYITNIYDQVQI